MRVPDREREYDIVQAAYTTGGVSGTGTASTLPMTDEEKQGVVRRPIGFAPPKGTA